jgi:hypothetical protein
MRVSPIPIGLGGWTLAVETKLIELPEVPDLAGRLDRIRSISREIELLPDETYAPQGSFLADVEWFSLAAVTKSTSNANAFELLVNARNTVAAAAVVRMQIEAAMRLFGLTLVDDIEDAGTKLMHGAKYSSLKLAGTKDALRDKILHEELSKEYEWVSESYEATSAYVHLDRMNVTSKLTHLDHDTFFNLSGVDAKWPESAYYDLADTFYIALRMTRNLLQAFLAERPQPEARAAILQKWREERDGKDRYDGEGTQ